MILGLASHPQSTVKASESSHVSCSGAQRMAAGDIAGPNLTVVCVPRAQFRSFLSSQPLCQMWALPLASCESQQVMQPRHPSFLLSEMETVSHRVLV